MTAGLIFLVLATISVRYDYIENIKPKVKDTPGKRWRAVQITETVAADYVGAQPSQDAQVVSWDSWEIMEGFFSSYLCWPLKWFEYSRKTEWGFEM